MSNRLLIIDDAVIHRKILARVAEKAGFETTDASSFDEAAALVRNHRFDCITLDLSLGDHAGAEILNLLAAQECRAPIIIISGSNQTVCDDTLKIGKSLGLNIGEPVPKPVDLSALREQLLRIAQYVSLQKLAGVPA